MKSKLMNFFGFTGLYGGITFLVLIWLQGGGRYAYVANERINFLGTAIFAIIIGSIITLIKLIRKDITLK